MNTASYFVTGTDTDVGKTIVSAALALGLKHAGMTCCPMKPVQTGCTPAPELLQAPDLDFSLSMLGMKNTPEMCPYRYLPACSPHLAAQHADDEIVLDEITRCFHLLAKNYTAVIVEGAGGILVPLNSKQTMRDLMVEMALPVILTARSGLGTINHTLLSVEALRQAGLTLAGIVFTDAHPTTWTAIEEDNLRTLADRSQAPVLGHIPYFELINDVDAARTYLTGYGTSIVKILLQNNHG